MNKAGRCWSQASQMKPAVEYDIRCDSGLLKLELAPSCMEKKGANTILRHQPITGL